MIAVRMWFNFFFNRFYLFCCLFYLFCLCSFFFVVFDDGLSATFEVLPHGGCVSAKTTKMNDESSSLVVSHVLERTVDELFEGFLHQEEVR